MPTDGSAEIFLRQLEGRLGASGRPNHTIYSYEIVRRSFAPLRERLAAGRRLSDNGERFVAGAAHYLAETATRAWKAAGFSVDSDGASRVATRAGERYEQDFLSATRSLLLNPPSPFPWARGRVTLLRKEREPSPEYLFLMGSLYMELPSARSSRESSLRFGGSDADFFAIKEALVDQLAEDCGMRRIEGELRKLAGWAVFPPLGLSEAPAQGQNMLAMLNLVSQKESVSIDAAKRFLRALLNSQAPHLRDLAARCLFIYRIPPETPLEALHFHRAFTGSDSGEALGFIARLRWQLEKHGSDEEPGHEWIEALDKECCRWLEEHTAEPWRRDPVFKDPDYRALAELDDKDVHASIRAVERIEIRYPGNWFLRTLSGSLLMKGPDRFRGEKILREQMDSAPACPEAHYRLATLLRQQSRAEDAVQVYESCLAKFPWEFRASDEALGLLAASLVEV